MMYDDKYEKITLMDNDDNSSYDKHHLILNVNNVITKIKDLFYEKYTIPKPTFTRTFIECSC